jgi:hypothetical protein
MDHEPLPVLIEADPLSTISAWRSDLGTEDVSSEIGPLFWIGSLDTDVGE